VSEASREPPPPAVAVRDSFAAGPSSATLTRTTQVAGQTPFFQPGVWSWWPVLVGTSWIVPDRASITALARCVRQAYLCGKDSHTKKDYSHRRGWIRERMEQLAALLPPLHE
jgi:hypothetical protein